MRNMSDSPELVTAFATFCDEMAGSKFILAEGKISNVLRTIAASSILFKIFEDALSDFDFAHELNKCKIPNSFNRISLRFPGDRRKHIALIFTLLVEFDSKRRDLFAFIKEFYCADSDVADGYVTFVRSTISTFKQNVLFLIENGDDVDAQSAADYFELVDSDSSDDERSGDIKQKGIDLVSDIREIIGKVAVDSSLNVSEREDMLILSEGLSTAIMSKNSKLIKISWIGLKNTLRLKRMYEERATRLAASIAGYLELL